MRAASRFLSTRRRRSTRRPRFSESNHCPFHRVSSPLASRSCARSFVYRPIPNLIGSVDTFPGSVDVELVEKVNAEDVGQNRTLLNFFVLARGLRMSAVGVPPVVAETAPPGWGTPSVPWLVPTVCSISLFRESFLPVSTDRDYSA